MEKKKEEAKPVAAKTQPPAINKDVQREHQKQKKLFEKLETEMNAANERKAKLEAALQNSDRKRALNVGE